MDFFFLIIILENHCIPAFVSGVLLSPESRTYFDCCACLVGSWPRLFAPRGYGCSPCLRIKSLALEGCFVGDSARGWLYRQNLKAVMALGLVQWLLLFPSSLTSAVLLSPAAGACLPRESGSSTAIHAAPGQGSDRLEKLGFFFQIRPLASVVHALQQPVELAVTLDIREAR